MPQATLAEVAMIGQALALISPAHPKRSLHPPASGRPFHPPRPTPAKTGVTPEDGPITSHPPNPRRAKTRLYPGTRLLPERAGRAGRLAR